MSVREALAAIQAGEYEPDEAQVCEPEELLVFDMYEMACNDIYQIACNSVSEVAVDESEAAYNWHEEIVCELGVLEACVDTSRLTSGRL